MFGSKHLIKLLANDPTKLTKRLLTAATHEKVTYKKMRAWQIHSYGDLNELQLGKSRIPLITSPTEVLVEVKAASLNPIDFYMTKGYGKTIFSVLRQNDLEFPLTLGRDFSGVIVDKGYSVGSEYSIGDKVYGILPIQKQGSHAEYVVAEAANILPHPEHLNFTAASSILYTAMTAWSALYYTGNLIFREPGHTRVLILGASGGVGVMAVQILKARRATVIGACATDAVPLVLSLGADNVLDYKSPDYINKVAAEGKYDIILDCAQFGYDKIPDTWRYDIYITLNSPLLVNTDKYGLMGGVIASASDFIGANIWTCSKGKQVRWGFFMLSREGLVSIDRLVKSKQITPMLHKVFKFDEMPKAYETLAGGHLRGKIVVDMES